MKKSSYFSGRCFMTNFYTPMPHHSDLFWVEEPLVDTDMCPGYVPVGNVSQPHKVINAEQPFICVLAEGDLHGC